MFTEARSRLGWRTGASRVAMKEQLKQLQSFDPAERASGGERLVELGLNRCSDALLDHVANEFDSQVLAAVAQAVLRAPADAKEARKAQELRAWAAAEVERSALEDSFVGAAPASAGRFELPAEADVAGLDPEREPLPTRVPAAVVPGETEQGEYRFDLPPETDPVDTDAAFEAVVHPTELAQPAPPGAYDTVPAPPPYDGPDPTYPVEPEPAYPEPEPAYATDIPTPVGAPGREASSTETPVYIYWRPPADDAALVEVNGGNHHPAAAVSGDPDRDDSGDPGWPGVELPVRHAREALGIDEPAPGELRFAGPEPLAPPEVAPATNPGLEPPPDEQPFEQVLPAEAYGPAPAESPPVEMTPANPFPEYRFEPPDAEAAPPAPPEEDTTESTRETGPPRTLAERLRARNA